MEDINEYDLIPINQRLESAYRSKHGLYPHEIAVLNRSYKYPEDSNWFHAVWKDRYGIDNDGMKKILNKLLDEGFIRYVPLNIALTNYKVVELKKFLKDNNEKVSGSKTILIDRIIKNFSIEDIEKYFPTRYYEHTELGLEELEDNRILVYVNDNSIPGVDIWEVNKLMQYNTEEEVINEVIRMTDKFINDALVNMDYYSYLRESPCIIFLNIKFCNFENALRILSNRTYLEINRVRFFQNHRWNNYYYNIDYLQEIFPFRAGPILSMNNKLALSNLKDSLGLDRDQLVEAMCEYNSDIIIPFELFTNNECANIGIYDMEDDVDSISKVYDSVETRIKEKNISNEEFILHMNSNIKKALSEEAKERMDKKEQILLDSFNLLKDDVLTNHDSIGKIMAQLQEFNPEMVIELWKFLLEDNWDKIVRDKEKYNSIAIYLTADIMKHLTEENSFLVLEQFFVSEPKILKAVYKYSPSLDRHSTNVIGSQIKRKNFEIANTMLGYMFENKKNDFIRGQYYSDCTFSAIFESMIKDHLNCKKRYYSSSGWNETVEVDEEIFEFLSYWVEKISDEEEKARTKVVLMELI